MDELYQRAGADLVRVNLEGAGVSPGALAVEDGMLVVDTDKSGGVTFTVTDGMLEASA